MKKVMVTGQENINAIEWIKPEEFEKSDQNG